MRTGFHRGLYKLCSGKKKLAAEHIVSRSSGITSACALSLKTHLLVGCLGHASGTTSST